jgi:hypothetical protein
VNGAQFIRDVCWVSGSRDLRPLPFRTWTLPCMEYTEDLQAITAYPIRNQI